MRLTVHDGLQLQHQERPAIGMDAKPWEAARARYCCWLGQETNAAVASVMFEIPLLPFFTCPHLLPHILCTIPIPLRIAPVAVLQLRDTSVVRRGDNKSAEAYSLSLPSWPLSQHPLVRRIDIAATTPRQIDYKSKILTRLCVGLAAL